jgi:hypothetical protein
MKNLIFLFLALCVFACSRFAKDNQKPKPVLLTHKESVDTLRGKTDTLKSITYQLLKKDEADKLLAEFDLTPTIFNKDQLDQYFNRHDGFFGKSNYRIEVYWSQVVKDSLQPNLYHLTGKTKFKENINSYKGTITIDSIYKFKDPNIAERYYEEGALMNDNLYEFIGKIELNEDSAQYGSGSFKGKIAIDFAKKDKTETFLWFYTPETKTKGSGFKAEGTWTSYTSKSQKQFVFAKDLFVFANSILADFSYGEREVEINPKYRHLGWQNFWDMKEWWHDEPAVAVQ